MAKHHEGKIMKHVLLIAALAWVEWGTALGGPPTDRMDSCAVLKADAARLACFDRELARRKASLQAAAKKPVSAKGAQPDSGLPGAAPTQEATADSVRDGQGLRTPHREESVARPPHPQPRDMQVVSVERLRDGRFTVTLENGQVWEQNEPREDFRIAQHQSVTITAGLFGSFFLTTEPHQTVRVRRIR